MIGVMKYRVLDNYSATFHNESDDRTEEVFEIQHSDTGHTVAYATSFEDAHQIVAALELAFAVKSVAKSF